MYHYLYSVIIQVQHEVDIVPVKPTMRICCDGEAGGEFHCKEHDFTISLMPNCAHGQVKINVNAYLSSNLEVSDGIYIVSPVFDVKLNVKLLQPATVKMLHFVNLESEDHARKMKFYVAHGSTNEIKPGCFDVDSQFGTIQLSDFSKVFIVWMEQSIPYMLILKEEDDLEVNSQSTTSQIVMPQQQQNSTTSSHNNKVSSHNSETSCQSTQASPCNAGVSSHNTEASSHNAEVLSQTTQTLLHNTEAPSHNSTKASCQSKVQQSPMTPFKVKYSEIIVLPQHRCTCPNDWRGIYCIACCGGTWRQVNNYIVSIVICGTKS